MSLSLETVPITAAISVLSVPVLQSSQPEYQPA